MEPSFDRQQRQHAYRRLLQNFRASRDQPAEERWHWLGAAHAVGQIDFRLHLHSHAAMLGFAVATRDWRECVGQLFRLALVPVGHLLGRLPAGNIGRATVSAFAPMPLDPALRDKIGEAFREVRPKSAEGSRVIPS